MLDDRLRLRAAGELERDLSRNFLHVTRGGSGRVPEILDEVEVSAGVVVVGVVSR